ncbi:HAD-IA family hydrolase [Corynebacterium sp. UMB4614]|uniref:HAD family hydrolase n=1 Tax=Corynebacterium sp. UMB4614 TaxID=3046334 RepID=UPI0025517018|nr:HAD-IA family hydrolase [Corynebacterium sp. UMB4614]MDK7134597.1 HAD-IA family hydrolase [Corynebacterium sp. UMB4614]
MNPGNVNKRQPETSTSGQGSGTADADLPDLWQYGAILFDLDGVITPTADLHREAWAHMFTEYFRELGAGGQSVAEYTDQDYYDYLDGRPRTEGIAALLHSRGIDLPTGSEEDTAAEHTVYGLGERKNAEFLRLLGQGIAAYPGSVQLLDTLTAPKGGATPPRLAIVSSSKNARPVLEAAGLLDRFELVVDGLVAAELELPGKPAPDTYLHAATWLGVPAEKAVVVEDALSGVASGRNGKFGLVVGVDRGAGDQELLDAGADTVVADLADFVG